LINSFFDSQKYEYSLANIPLISNMNDKPSINGSTPAKTSTPSEADPNDLDSLWAPMELIQTRMKKLTIPAGTRPPKDKFIRILPFDMGGVEPPTPCKNCRPVYLFEYQFYGEMIPKTFYVRPESEVADLLAERGRIRKALLVLGVVRHGSPFVWELKLPDGRNESGDKWAESRFQIARLAVSKWLKPVADMSAGGYDSDEPIKTFDEPDWSQVDFDESIRAACNGRIIETLEHEAVVEALGL